MSAAPHLDHALAEMRAAEECSRHLRDMNSAEQMIALAKRISRDAQERWTAAKRVLSEIREARS